MDIIFLSKNHSGTRSIKVGGVTLALISICFMGLPAGAGITAYQWLEERAASNRQNVEVEQLRQQLLDQQVQIETVKVEAQHRLDAMTARLAEVQARALRLDAVGERLANMAELDDGEFNFSAAPPLGGPDVPSQQNVTAESLDVLGLIDSLSVKLEDTESQLSLLEDMMADRRLHDDVQIAGRPILSGWMSSGFGTRTDPFHGKPAWHNGVDFAGKLGADIVTVGGGVVTWSGERYGYGTMVEVNHGNGFVSRYAHNQKNYVAVGDIVKKGQVIAAMGSSGRSTGPHVHFEIFKHGRAVDPASYVRRTRP